jgi:hypothetical protein
LAKTKKNRPREHGPTKAGSIVRRQRAGQTPQLGVYAAESVEESAETKKIVRAQRRPTIGRRNPEESSAVQTTIGEIHIGHRRECRGLAEHRLTLETSFPEVPLAPILMLARRAIGSARQRMNQDKLLGRSRGSLSRSGLPAYS